ncbi:unnamed protein product, partial [Staurois parvus]
TEDLLWYQRGRHPAALGPYALLAPEEATPVAKHVRRFLHSLEIPLFLKEVNCVYHLYQTSIGAAYKWG